MEAARPDDFIHEWRDQQLALFARRAHRQLGRGFVISEGIDSKPVYVTRIAGAPRALVEAVMTYDPESEALVVQDKGDGDTIHLTCVRIEIVH